ncbi:hypothetical protein CEXT_810371 [Caerostris extrusa]|uniref:LIM zinc-binding domain-containing protein n=1 Tax=Caerostris extrusa TaxID=172846 RepID=A0AAV4UD32_CAEEX|nr:hypothetical protein CEXT_810371 [Caerostris extrusa]
MQNHVTRERTFPNLVSLATATLTDRPGTVHPSKVATQVLPNCSLNSYTVDSKVSLVSELSALGLSYEPLRSSKVDTLGGWRGRGGRTLPLIRTDDMKMVQCAGCERPIMDRYLCSVLDRSWHAKCVLCCECKCTLQEKCFSREGKLYCRNDFFK